MLSKRSSVKNSIYSGQHSFLIIYIGCLYFISLFFIPCLWHHQSIYLMSMHHQSTNLFYVYGIINLCLCFICLSFFMFMASAIFIWCLCFTSLSLYFMSMASTVYIIDVYTLLLYLFTLCLWHQQVYIWCLCLNCLSFYHQSI